MNWNKIILLALGPILTFAATASTAFATSSTAPATSSTVSVADSTVSVAAPILNLSLKDCRDLALRNNPYLKNAELDVLAAQAQKREALSEYFPTVGIQALGFYAFDPMLQLNILDMIGNPAIGMLLGGNTTYDMLKQGFSATVTATQPIFAGGRIYNGNRLAALGIEAAGLQRDIQERGTGEDAEQKYWRVVSLEERYGFLDEVEALLDTLYKDVSAAVDAGVVTGTDLLQIQLKRNELKSNRIQLRNGIRLSKMDLCNSIGVRYNPYLTIRNDSIPYIDDIHLTDGIAGLAAPQEYYQPEEEIASRQEEMQLLDLSVRSKEIEKKMALGEALPSLGVGVSYGYSNILSEGTMNGAVYGVLKIPISDWGKTSRKMQRIDYQMQKAENERNYLQDQLVLQIHKLWLDLTSAYERWQVAEESALTVEAVHSQMREHYLAGMVPVSDLLQVQTELADARTKVVESKIEYKIALQAYIDRLD